MEVERIGPLSYDVTVPDRDPSAQRGIIYGLLATAGGWLVAVVGGWLALGWLPDARVVSRGFPLALVAVALAAAFVGTRRSTPRARRNGALAVLGVATGAALLAGTTLASVSPALPQLRRALDTVELPAGFRVVSEDTRGDRFCRRGCPTVERVYAAPAGDPDPVRTMILAMFDQGWQPTTDVPRELATSAQRGSIFVHLGETDPHTVEVTVTRQS